MILGLVEPASRRNAGYMPTGSLTTSATARILGVSAERVRQLADSGALRCERTALGRLFDPDDVTALAARRLGLAPRTEDVKAQ